MFPFDDIEFMKNIKWICSCGLEFTDMEEVDTHQCKTDHPIKRVKIDPSK